MARGRQDARRRGALTKHDRISLAFDNRGQPGRLTMEFSLISRNAPENDACKKRCSAVSSDPTRLGNKLVSVMLDCCQTSLSDFIVERRLRRQDTSPA